ncbi:hypothetical protein [Salinarchaeum laminariae]|uniref:hypothetical protein n=1 Tax=Salinarchaeum laminariae TaxID=869888 RepID=UPI0020BE36A8|nr:hypothetical protein [Salinarchaeum laminariae]
MSKLGSLRENFHDPFWWRRQAIPYLIRSPAKQYLKFRYTPSAPKLRLMDEDWDNIIILDACRYDQFKRHNTIPGELQVRTSRGSATPEFLTANFDGEIHHDTVYVTANPMYRTRGLENVFHDVVDVWKDEWDEEWRTVYPEQMASRTLEAYREYPEKRIISHFMQPHYPFIGDAADELGAHSGFELTYRKAQGKAAKRDDPTVWELLENGKVDEELVWDAYNETLEIALGHVEPLVDEFPEKTVVTSDHGNFVGERVLPFGNPKYGHPVGVYADELRKVPWLVIEGDERKTVKSETTTPHDHDSEPSATVSDRLVDLGYIDQ